MTISGSGLAMSLDEVALAACRDRVDELACELADVVDHLR